MASTQVQSYIGGKYEPRAVDIRNIRAKERAPNRCYEYNDDHVKPRPRRVESHRSSKETVHRHKVSQTLPQNVPVRRPHFFLDVTRQPAKSIQLGMEIDLCAVVGVKLSSIREKREVENMDSTNFFAGVSLVAYNRHGESMPLESGMLTSQKLFDSTHPLQKPRLEFVTRNQQWRSILGYCLFPGLLIRQPGTYRLRVTLFDMSSCATTGATSVVNVDSDPIEVVRPGYTTQGRQQIAVT